MFMPRRKRLAISLGVLAILGFTGAAQGVVVGFDCITWNDAGAAEIGQQQLWMDIRSPQDDQVAFTFHNTGPDNSTIAQVYFETGPLADLLSIVSPAGVQFQEGGNPRNLPGGNVLTPAFQAGFRATAANPAPRNGVNNTLSMDEEWVTLVFGLSDGNSYADVIQELVAGELRVGLHVQDFDSGSSEAFLNKTRVTVPEPASLGFGIMALLGIGLMRGPRRLVLPS